MQIINVHPNTHRTKKISIVSGGTDLWNSKWNWRRDVSVFHDVSLIFILWLAWKAKNDYTPKFNSLALATAKITTRSSIARMAILWVECYAQLQAWVSSLVTKPGLACCENAHISNSTANCSYIFQQTCHLWQAFHAILHLVWEGPAKKWHVCPQVPTGHPYRFHKFEPHIFYSIPSAICLESSVEILSPVLEKSPVKDECRWWVQTRQRFLGMV